MADRVFCSEYSLAAGEPLFATASRVETWFCLEYAGAWGRNALKDSDLPESVKNHLAEAETSIPYSRVELIKQDRRQGRDGVKLFVAISSETDPCLYQFSLDSYEGVLDLDLDQIASRAHLYESFQSSESLILVCTNGKRDPCCARNGIVVYQALKKDFRAQTWQCTHLGGHRFAANVAVLPFGLLYGHATPDRAVALANVSNIDLDLFRGRTCYSEPVQAAESFLRRELTETSVSSIHLHRQNQTGDTEWEITMNCGDRSYLLSVKKVQTQFGTYISCGEDVLKDVNTFKLSSLTEATV